MPQLDIFKYIPLASAEGGHLVWGIFAYSAIVFVCLGVLIYLARQGLGERVPKKIFTQLAEHLYHFVENMCLSIIGSHGRKYVPFIMTLWMLIFVGNLVGLIFPHTPNADWSLNLSMSIITIIYVQYEGIKAHGLFGHLRHFAGPKVPFPWILALLFSVFMFSIEIVSEFMKMASLSLRLYSNIYGGHLVVDALNNMVVIGGVSVPLGLLVLLPLKFLAAIIQALVFTMLSCVYLSLVTGSSDHDSHDSSDSPDQQEKKSEEGATALA